MGKGNIWSNELLALLFNATTAPNIAINATSSPITSIYVSLHTANPGAGGNQSTSECTYGSYARVAVIRTSGGWTVSGNSVIPVASINFPIATSGTQTATYCGFGTLASGAGVLLYSGTITPSITIITGIQPILTTGTTITET